MYFRDNNFHLFANSIQHRLHNQHLRLLVDEPRLVSYLHLDAQLLPVSYSLLSTGLIYSLLNDINQGHHVVLVRNDEIESGATPADERDALPVKVLEIRKLFLFFLFWLCELGFLPER